MAGETENLSEQISFHQKLLDIQLKILNRRTGLNEALKLSNDLADEAVKSAQKRSEQEKARLTLEARMAKITRDIEIFQTGIAKGIKLSAEQTQFLVDAERQYLDLQKTISIIMEETSKKLRAQNTTYELLNRVGLGGLILRYKEYIDLQEKFGKQTAIIFTVISSLGSVFRFIRRVFNEMDQAAADFRKTIGATRAGTAGIEKSARSIAFDFAHVGVSAKDAYASFAAMAESIGTTQALTKDMAVDTSLMAAQLNIAQSTSIDFIKTMGMVAGMTMDSQKNMALFTQQMAEAGGVPLGKVMEDVAGASKSSYQFLSRSPLALAKAAVEARRMGTSLADTTKSAASLIDFSNSIKAEMEASVLVGKNINLQKARELAYNKDLISLNKEILKLAKEVDFNQLDPFQQEAFSKALGKTSGEVAQILQAEKERRAIEVAASRDPKLKEQLNRYKSMEMATAAIAKNEAENARTLLRTRSNQAAITAVTQSWNAIIQRVAEKFMPHIATILGGIAKFLGMLNNSTIGWTATIIAAGAALFGVVAMVVKLAGLISGELFSKAGEGAGKFLTGLSEGLESMGKVSWASIAKGAVILLALGASLIPLAFALKLMTGITWKTLGVAGVAIVGLTAALVGLGFLFMSPVGAALGVGIIALAGMGLALIPLAYVFNKVSESMIRFSSGLSSIVDSLGRLQSLSLLGITLQVLGLSAALRDLSTTVASMPQIDVEKIKSIGAVSIGAQPGAAAAVGSTSNTNDLILTELKGLRSDLLSGGIKASVRIGAQELVAYTAREYSRLGNLGPTRKEVGQ